MTLTDLQNEVAGKLCEIEDICSGCNLDMSRLTLIARNPNNDKMFILVTSEPDMASVERAFEIAKHGEKNE